MEKSLDIVAKDTIIRPGEGEPFLFGGVGRHFKISGESTGDRFAVAQLPEIPPRTLAAPLHRYHNEAERGRIEALREAGDRYWASMTEALGKAVDAWIRSSAVTPSRLSPS